MTDDGSTQGELEKLRAENQRLRALLGLHQPSRHGPIAPWEPTLFGEPDPRAKLLTVDRRSSRQAKVALFQALFAGRDDVYALRWENSRSGKSGWSPAVVGGWVNSRKPGRAYIPISAQVVESHLGGNIHAGMYPLLRGDMCRLLACDFDGPDSSLDALAYLDAAQSAGIPVALERSRSGDGSHV